MPKSTTPSSETPQISIYQFGDTNIKEMKNIALYFGTFDPFHLGHQYVVLSILNLSYVDGIIIIPSPDNANFELKFKMICDSLTIVYNVAVTKVAQEMYQDNNCIPVSEYTILDRFQKRMPDAQFHIAIGMDKFNKISSWKDIDKFETVSFIVFNRQGYDIDIEQLSSLKSKYPELNFEMNTILDTTTATSISSRSIKKLISELEDDRKKDNEITFDSNGVLDGLLHYLTIDLIVNNRDNQLLTRYIREGKEIDLSQRQIITYSH